MSTRSAVNHQDLGSSLVPTALGWINLSKTKRDHKAFLYSCLKCLCTTNLFKQLLGGKKNTTNKQKKKTHLTVSSLSLSGSLSAANLCTLRYIHPSFMCLIIKGLWKCSAACAFAWVSSGKWFAFCLDVYGFMHGPTYCVIGHHSNDIVAFGRHLQRSARLQVNGWIRAWACFRIRVKRRKKNGFLWGEAGVHPQGNQSNRSA